VRRAMPIVLLALLLAVVAAAGCGGDGDEAQEETAPAETDTTAGEAEPPDQPVTIRMGWGIPAEEVKYVMMERPEVAPNLGTWYELDWQQFAGTALGVQGLAAGTLDCATVGGLSSANGFEQGADFVLTGEIIEEATPPQEFSTTWLALADSGIESLEDLRGKTVATSAIGGSTDYLQDIYVEREAGLRPGQDYEKVEIPFSQQQEALLAGRIDVGLYPQPFWGAITAETETTQLFRVTDVINPFVQLLNGCRREFIEENPDVMRKFVEDWATVTNWVRDPANRDAVIEVTSQVMQIPRDVLDTYLLTEQDYLRPENGAISLEALQEEWDFFREAGGISEDLEVDDFIMEGYVPEGTG
jgi:ABC-type nitrate/sulfonate/bicarbonate transport system substrate-binding protein